MLTGRVEAARQPIGHCGYQSSGCDYSQTHPTGQGEPQGGKPGPCRFPAGSDEPESREEPWGVSSCGSSGLTF